MATDLMEPAAAAVYLTTHERTLRQWRWNKKGPVYIKVGGLVRYKKADLDTWLEAQRVCPETKEAAA